MSEGIDEGKVLRPDPAGRERSGRLAYDGGWIVEGVSIETASSGDDRPCPLCGQRLPSKESLARHSLRPHFRSNRPVRRVVAGGA